MVSKMVYGPVLHAARLMKFLSVRNRASGPGNIGSNEFALASAVKEDLTCSGSSLPNLWPIGLGRYARHALDIMLGETYQQPQASSVER